MSADSGSSSVSGKAEEAAAREPRLRTAPTSFKTSPLWRNARFWATCRAFLGEAAAVISAAVLALGGTATEARAFPVAWLEGVGRGDKRSYPSFATAGTPSGRSNDGFWGRRTFPVIRTARTVS